MYKIFINEKPFIITSADVQEERFAKCKRVSYDPAKISSYIKLGEEMKSKGIVMLSEDVELAFKDFYTHFVAIEAAGGMVFNALGELLLIKRLGKWDLPKGKIDGEEGTEEAAIREVMEECGIHGLTIEKQLADSYHTYKMHNHRFLKITHWYKMRTSFDKKLVPQTEEHITEAKWFDWKKLNPDELDTYYSIRELLNALRSS
jgi:8-oxo-dGTP pyrophosphatase MutT (NUDIX family)